jgi:hypothetical protein
VDPANDDGTYATIETVALRSRSKLIAYLAEDSEPSAVLKAIQPSQSISADAATAYRRSVDDNRSKLVSGPHSPGFREFRTYCRLHLNRLEHGTPG